MRDWKRRSKGRKEGVGLANPGRDATDGGILLPGDDKIDPFGDVSIVPNTGQLTLLLGRKGNHQGSTTASLLD